MNILRFPVVLSVAFLIAACGGGSSSSGGGATPTPNIVYTGSYRTTFYNGTIRIEIPSEGRPIVSMTGIQCLTVPTSDQLTSSNRGDGSIRISGLINELIPPGNFAAQFPEIGGEGIIELGLSRDAGCTGSSVGSLSVARN